MLNKALFNHIPALRLRPSSRHADMLDGRHFPIAMAVAFALHMMVIGILQAVPREEVIDIPVRALNIKLGDGDAMTQEEIEAAMPQSGNNATVENAIARMVRDSSHEKARTESVVNSMEKAMDALNKATASTAFDKAMKQGNPQEQTLFHAPAKQFVRDAQAKGVASTAGNSTAADAELMSRYEQLISLWVQKFKLYPDEARMQGMEGETVVRVRIDRRGTIRYYTLERSTGYPALDRAAIDMIRRANPVPAVPNDYPQGDLLEFLIPVNFRLK